MPDQEKLSKEIYGAAEKEVKDLFGNLWDKYKEEIQRWAKNVAELKLKKAIIGTSPEMEKDLEYCMIAIRSLKQQSSGEIEDGMWKSIEKILSMCVRMVFTLTLV